MASGVKFRAYPHKEQSAVLNCWIGCQRFVYNSKVAEDRYFRTFRDHALALTGLQTPVDQQYSQFKDDELTPWLFEVPCQILRNGAYRFMQAYARFFKGLSQRPSRKKKLGRQSVLITKELFQFMPTGNTTKVNDGLVKEHRLLIGTGKFMVGELKFTAHRPYELPNSITIARHNTQWYVSFNYGDGEVPKDTPPLMTEKELLEYFSGLTGEELDWIANGLDRGVVIPVATSNGKKYDFTEAEKESLAHAQEWRKKLQQKFSKQCKGSKGREKTKTKIGRAYAKEHNIREDRAHKISHDIVENTAQVNIFEDLTVSNMVRRPKVKTAANGKFLKNGARAKAGLNKSILNSMWGRIVMFVRYKGLKKEKLTIKIPAHGTSQECSLCGHIHPDNRATQAIFTCQKCGLTLNADYNASLVIKRRGIKMLRNGEITAKDKKTVGFRKQDSGSQLGPGRSEVTCVEINVRRGAGNTRNTQRSMKREALTSTAVGS
ncbi:MAG: RNA-guided endonuclease InsQ/TnpB family protein [Dissulfurispiraceae bacterium]